MTTSRTRSLLAAPVLVVALAALDACGGSDDGSGTATDTSSPSSASDGTTETGTLALTADGSVTGKCAVPSAETLATFDTAFSGTVTSLDEGTATLAVDHWYAGPEAATVTIDAPSEDLHDLLMAVDFQEGRTYLVSATGGRVTLCGFTAEESPDLAALYDEAFTG